MAMGGVTIPPVVARIFLGDSTSPLTMGGKNVVQSEGGASNPSGNRPNFFGRQHLAFDKGRAWMPEVERPKFCRTQNKQSVHKARVMVRGEG